MPTSAPASKEANVAEAKLLSSALTLFSEKGYDGTSIREIIQGAGVTRPVLYYYFENKEDLFKRLVDDKFSVLVATMEDLAKAPGSCSDRLKSIMCKTFELSEENTEAVRLILQVFFAPPQYGPELDKEALAPRRFKIVEEVMREGLEKREIGGGDARSLAMVFLGMMDMHVMTKFDWPDIHLSTALGEGLVDLLFSGCQYTETPKTSIVSPLSTPPSESM